MAVVDIQSELAARNPGGTKAKIADTLCEIDESIEMLGLAADSAAHGKDEDRLIRSLYFIQRRLRNECDRLFQLL